MAKPSEPRPSSQAPPDQAANTPAKATLPAWKKRLLLIAIIVMAIGLGLKVYNFVSPINDRSPGTATSPSQAPSLAPSADSLVNPLAPVEPNTLPDNEPVSNDDPARFMSEDWSAVLFPLGFSFVVGFAIGYAARQFLRITVVSAGVILLALFGLQYAGIIDVNWAGVESHYHTAAHWLAQQTQSFREFLTGQLPSAGGASTGLFVGFRKR